jgi:starch synthase
MKIVIIAAEIAPFAKVGGLGDVVGALSSELSKKHDVEVILPKYSFLNFKNQKKEDLGENTVYFTNIKKVKLTLIDPKNLNYFKRKNIYGYKDDTNRFIYFSNASLEYLLKSKKEIDILHLHDWHTALSALLCKDLFRKRGLQVKKIILNIHNLKYQGSCKFKKLKKIGLTKKEYFITSKLKDKKIFPKANILKSGLIYSDAIIAVSKTYAKEMLTKEYGCGLEKILQKRKKKLFGILNGIDTEKFNPLKDPFLKYHYSSKDSVDKIIKQKNENKKFLQKKLKMNISSKPIFCSIGRLVPQKGPSLIEKSIFKTIKGDGQFILLGSSNVKKLKRKFFSLKKKLSKNRDVSLNFAFDEKLANQIYAAADFIIIPSQFEPCGLTQMIALRYGTIPIVRKTGGLADTVFDIESTNPLKNGFLFEKFSKKDLAAAINRALFYFFKKNEKLKTLIENGIKEDFTIEKSTKKYEEFYKKLLVK